MQDFRDGPGRDRTCDLGIKSPLLYQLSYRPAILLLWAKGTRKGLPSRSGRREIVDSSGVGELVSSFTTVRNAGGELKLLSLTKKVQDVLHVTKLYTVFDIKDDEFTAVKSFDYFFAK